MKTQHTPGPWSLSSFHMDTVIGPTGNVIAECCGYKEPTGDREKQGCREANAKLIAAAPELLEALEAAEQHLDYCNYGDSYESECARDEKLPEKIQAAIAKATT